MRLIFRRLLLLPATRVTSPHTQATLLPLRQLKTGATFSKISAMQNSSIKPPNILVFQPSKDSTSDEFVRTKEALETCLTPERYVIYALGTDDIIHKAPWQDNCILVFVPPTVGNVPSNVLQEFVAYLMKGGTLLSMNGSVNKSLGFQSSSLSKGGHKSLVSNVHVMHNGGWSNKPVSPDSGVGGVSEVDSPLTFHAPNVPGSHDYHVTITTSQPTLISTNQVPPLNDSISMVTSRATLAYQTPCDLEETNSNQSNNIPGSSRMSASPDHLPAVEKITTERDGCAVLCGVDLLPLPQGEMSFSLLVKLKKDVALRSKFMSSLLGELSLECSEDRIPELTHTYLVCSQEALYNFISMCAPLVKHSVLPGMEMSVRLIEDDFYSGTPVDLIPRPSSAELAIITQPARWQLDNQPFDFFEYFESLRSSYLGRTLLYTSVITSTQTLFTGNIDFCNALTSEMGVVCVAGQQTKGKGRSGNVWISPKGSMMFSTALKFSQTSRLAQRMTLLQHLVAMAVVHGIRTIPGYEDLPIRIKWPNDIYYKDQVKLGGILVTNFFLPKACEQTAVIGCGVNVSNKYPTMSVNDCVTLHNVTTGTALPPLSIEQCLARTLTSLEEFLSCYEESGMEGLEEVYYKYWLHSGSTVRLANHGNMEAVITGIDEYGYLLVRSRLNGHKLNLQPDGNTFDIMKGLIAMKPHTYT